MEAILKSGVFTASAVQPKTRKGGLMAVGLTEKIIVPVLPPAASDDTRRAFLFMIMCSGTSESTSLNAWKAYVAVYTVALFPGFQSKLSANVFTISQLTDAQVKAITDLYQEFKEALEAQDEAKTTDIVARMAPAAVIPGLPAINPSLEWSTANKQWALKVIIGHYSIVLFIMGKRVEGDDHSALSGARPDAIKRKAHIHQPIAFLDGDLRLSDESHVPINSAWAELSGFRAVVVTEFAQYAQSDTNFGQDLVYTTMHLLQWSGMNHAKITMNFLQAYDWVTEIPVLRTPLGIYKDSVNALIKVDPVLRPYVKLIYGDKSPIFPRKELEPLVACALEVAEEIGEDIKKFYRSNAYVAIVEAFMEERERRNRIREGRLTELEQRYGFETEELEEVGVGGEPVDIGLGE